MKSVYRICRSLEEVKKVISYCKVTGYASVDFETTGSNPRDPNFYPTIIGVSFQVGSSWIIPLGHFDSPFEDWREVFDLFAREVWENPAITKFAWNAIFETKVFLHYGYHVRGRLLDGLLAKYLLNEERPNDLKSITDQFLPDFAGYDLPGQPGKKASKEAIFNFWSNVELEELSEYCGLDCDNTFRLTLHFENRLIDLGLYHLLRNLYMPLVKVIAESTLDGVHIDRTYLKWLDGFFAKKIAAVEKTLFDIPEVEEYNEIFVEDKIEAYIDEIQDEIDFDNLSNSQIAAREEKISRVEAGEPTTKKELKLFENLNFGSPKQLIGLLYESEDGFEFPILGRSKTGAPATDETTLLKLKPYDESGFIDKLLEFRGIKKLYSTYVKNILEEQLTDEDRLHPSFLPFGTVTGRLSSRNPNFQNLPRVKGKDSLDSYIKKYIIPPPGCLFLESDGSQMELRVAAELARDKAMMEVYNQGKNIHVQTASLVFGIPYGDIQKARKDPDHPQHDAMVKKHKAAKVLNFTIFYGAGAKKVAEFLTERTGDYHTKEEAEEMIEDWFAAFPDIGRWIKRIRKQAKRDGYVTNMFGFKRRLPILLENPKQLQGKESYSYAEAERQAINSIIQGSASMITLWLAIKVYEAVRLGILPDYLKLVITVHDSIEYTPIVKDAARVVKTIQDMAVALPEMEDYLGATMKNVPMKFSSEIGINWGVMQEVERDMDYAQFYMEQWEKYNQAEFPHINYLKT